MGIAANLAFLPSTRFFGKPAVRVLGMADAAACVFVVAELVAFGPAFTQQTALFIAMLWNVFKGVSWGQEGKSQALLVLSVKQLAAAVGEAAAKGLRPAGHV